MTEFEMALSRAAAERAAAVADRSSRPSRRRDRQDPVTALRSPYRPAAAATPAFATRFQVERSGEGASQLVRLTGYATAYETPYEMWDFFGPYTEVVSAAAGSVSLAAGPDVKFLFNHRDMPMARRFAGPADEAEQAGRLLLSEDEHGLVSVAYPLMSLSISQQVVLAIEAGLIDEMSFAFTITRGEWSPDFTQYRIHEFDINRGDTSAVTYGANPFTEIAVERQAIEPAPTGLSLADRALARRVLSGHLLTEAR